MTEGIFIKRNVFSIICLICGLFLIGLFIFLGFVDAEANGSIFIGIGFGLIITIASIFGLLLNFKAFITVDGSHIKAKYNWFGRIDCDVSEIEFVINQINSMTIEMKSGKRHTIMGLANSFAICDEIIKQLPFEIKGSKNDIAEQIEKAKSERKTNIYICIGMLVMMFFMIFVAVFFTDAKEHLSDFNTKDWVIFSIAGSCLILALVMAFVYGARAGNANIPILRLEYTLRRYVALTQPIPDTRYLHVYIDSQCFNRLISFEDHFKIQLFVPGDNRFHNTDYAPDADPDKDFNPNLEETFSDLIEITDELYPMWFNK